MASNRSFLFFTPFTSVLYFTFLSLCVCPSFPLLFPSFGILLLCIIVAHFLLCWLSFPLYSFPFIFQFSFYSLGLCNYAARSGSLLAYTHKQTHAHPWRILPADICALKQQISLMYAHTRTRICIWLLTRTTHAHICTALSRPVRIRGRP